MSNPAKSVGIQIPGIRIEIALCIVGDQELAPARLNKFIAARQIVNSTKRAAHQGMFLVLEVIKIPILVSILPDTPRCFAKKLAQNKLLRVLRIVIFCSVDRTVIIHIVMVVAGYSVARMFIHGV